MPVAVVCLLLLLAPVGGVLAFSSKENDASDYAPSMSSEPYASSSGETPSSSSGHTSSSESSSSPAAGPQPVSALGNNPLNAPENGATNTPCELPSFATSVNGQDAFFQAAADCLITAWAPSLEYANLPLRKPSVVTSGQDMNTPCGTRRWNDTAMYCPGNHTIYMTARHYSQVEGQTQAGVYLGQFAHEFGHAVQGMSGINNAYANAMYEAGGIETPRGLELSRRNELQATCYEGMALAALQNGGVSNNYIMPALKDSSERGDQYNPQPDHGAVATNKAWVDQGFYKNRVFQCNTWNAASSDVD